MINQNKETKECTAKKERIMKKKKKATQQQLNVSETELTQLISGVAQVEDKSRKLKSDADKESHPNYNSIVVKQHTSHVNPRANKMRDRLDREL
jgi:hypothetical protein